MTRHILLLITDLEIGGTPTVVRELARRLNDPPKVEIAVACLATWGPVADEVRGAGISVTALGAGGAIDFFSATRKIVRLIRSNQMDTVFSFLVHANAVAAAASLFCRDVRFLQSIQTTQPRPAWHWRIQAVVQHAAERVIVPSPSAADVAHERSGVPRDKIVVISNAIDPDAFERSAPPAMGMAAGRFPVGFIGRLDPVKRIDDLIQAMIPLSDRAHLHIYGEGPQRAHLESYRTQTDCFTLRGQVARPQDALAGLALLVLPSDAEGFGLVLIEAMAAGVPVIGTNVPGIRDVIRDGENGLLVPARSPRDLTRAIARLIEDRKLRESLITGGLRTVREHYTWESVIPRYQRLLGIGSDR